ncbi:MAG: T9SS type A sorting domain-containing protein [Bacteroidetes bacterium]|nr:T9SS type A sorting domain-containing protein [Bacteroidota bacterium]
MRLQSLICIPSLCVIYLLNPLFITTIHAQVPGCTDKLANNYNAIATINNGSCIYNPAFVNVANQTNLPNVLKGTSGLIWMNDKWWSQNNFSDINLYAFTAEQVNQFETVPVTGTVNTDWEEIAQDESYLYIGDFGNNVNGNRKNLQILRVQKSSMTTPSWKIDTIQFSYETQVDFAPTGANKTNYDCEAFVVTRDSIYLFTKEWLSNQCSIYRLPKTPGSYQARFESKHDVQGLITGATYLPDSRLIVLCGYSSTLQPFLYLLYDFPGNAFFKGNKRKLNLSLPFHQVEAIATRDGLNYFLTNEAFSQSVISVPQKFLQLSLSDYLSPYLATTQVKESAPMSAFRLFPVPACKELYLSIPNTLHPTPYKISDLQGRLMKKGYWRGGGFPIFIGDLPSGLYHISVGSNPSFTRQWLKQ